MPSCKAMSTRPVSIWHAPSPRVLGKGDARRGCAWRWASRGERRYDFDDIMLLKIGRHLRPHPSFKLIIGREEGENRFLEGYRQRFVHLWALDHKGPLALLQGDVDEAGLDLACAITARFGQGRCEARVRMAVGRPGGPTRERDVAPLPAHALAADWYL